MGMGPKRTSLVSLAAVAFVAGLALASQAVARTSGGVTSQVACGGGNRTFVPASYAPALKTYDDAIEDSGNAPDFCASELVTNDNQTVTIGIHAHNRSAVLAGDSYGVYLDTDLNSSTGGGGVGAEYEITIDGTGAQLERWDGTSFVASGASRLPTAWIPDYGPVVSLPRTTIGDAKGFNFVFVSANGTDTDRAPDSGSWAYSVTPFALKVKSFSIGLAHAGKPFTARALVMRSDFDVPVSEGKIGCSAKLAGRSYAGRGKFAGDRIACTWRLPKQARGKRFAGSVSVSLEGVLAKRSFSVRVR
jgi:hypothetical protein